MFNNQILHSMNEFNFDDFAAVQKANKRKSAPRTSFKYDFRMRRVNRKQKDGEIELTSNFNVSQDAFDRLGLASKGLRSFVNGSPATALLLGLTSEDMSLHYKAAKGNATKKSLNFKSSELDRILTECGLAEPSGEVVVYFDFVSEGKDISIGAIACSELFSLKAKTKEETTEEVETVVTEVVEEVEEELPMMETEELLEEEEEEEIINEWD